MTPPERPWPAPSDDQVVRMFLFITIGYAGALVLILALVPFLFPDGSISVRGLAVGVVLALVSWFGSMWAINWALASAARSGRPDAVAAAGAVRTATLVGIATAEMPPLLALVYAYLDVSEVGALVVAVPVAIVALVVNVSGPGAVRRHLEQIRS